MRLIDQSVEILTELDTAKIMQSIELYGRTCYKSEGRITDGSANAFVSRIIASGHESVIEHISLSARFITNRGVTHELVRHRIGSYSQESTRYCNYGSEDITYIIPVWLHIEPGIYDCDNGVGDLICAERVWMEAMLESEVNYNTLINLGWKPQQAREVLPNSLKTDIVVTFNLREWRHFFKLRTSKAAHPQMRAIALDLLRQMKVKLPIIFNDIRED